MIRTQFGNYEGKKRMIIKDVYFDNLCIIYERQKRERERLSLPVWREGSDEEQIDGDVLFKAKRKAK